MVSFFLYKYKCYVYNNNNIVYNINTLKILQYEGFYNNK